MSGTGIEYPARAGPAAIVAVARASAIGRGGQLPWHAPEDLAHFKRVTRGHQVILGSTTWESIGRPLPERHLVVVSHRRLDLPDGVTVAASPAAALEAALAVDPSPVVAGGSAIYGALMGQVVRLYRTDIDTIVDDADAWFDEPDGTWSELARWSGVDPRLTFRVLDRI